MDVLISIITILSYIIVILAIILTAFIYISFLCSDIIVKKLADRIKEKRKEFIKIALQDISLFIQVTIGIGISLLLFSLSRTGVEVMAWGFLSLICITTAVFLIFWRYLPLRNKMYKYYKK